MNEREPDFNADDVRRVAEAAIGSAMEYCHSHGFGTPEHYECRWCGAWEDTSIRDSDEAMAAAKHKPDCVVLVARDILT